ncbi:hypothetical protein KAH37_00300 [bacterium]|nr:hypothetical protein [bacterium]
MKRLLLLLLTILFFCTLYATDVVWSSPPYSTGGGITITIPVEKGDEAPSALFKTESENVAITAVKQLDKSVEITLVPLDTGEVEVPEITVVVGTKEIAVSAKKITINAITTEQQTDLKDLKKSAIATIEDYFLLWVGLGLLGLLLLGWLIYYLIKKRRKEQIVVERIIPPFDVAMGYYTKASVALENDDIDGAVDNITIGIRHYLEVRTAVLFLEMTTREVIKKYREEDLDEKSLELLTKVLKTGDRYKFAEENLREDELTEMLVSFSSILQKTEELFAQKEEEKKAKKEVNDALS